MTPPDTALAEKIEGPSGETEELISDSEAIAHACRLADVDVITAYPIRPYDTVMQYVSKMIADGDFDCEFIVAESEHSQFEIVKHASTVGARVFCGSSGVGWFYAFEALAVTAGLRVPMVAMVGNRALDDPGAFGGSIHRGLCSIDPWGLTSLRRFRNADHQPPKRHRSAVPGAAGSRHTVRNNGGQPDLRMGTIRGELPKSTVEPHLRILGESQLLVAFIADCAPLILGD